MLCQVCVSKCPDSYYVYAEAKVPSEDRTKLQYCKSTVDLSTSTLVSFRYCVRGGGSQVKLVWNIVSCLKYFPYTVEPHLSSPDPTYPDTCLGTNPHSSTESASLIQKFSYPDSQSGNGGVRISEAQLYKVVQWLVALFSLKHWVLYYIYVFMWCDISVRKCKVMVLSPQFHHQV